MTNNSFDIDLSNACDGHGMIHHCPSLYVSVQGLNVASSPQLHCTDQNCQFPSDLRFAVHTENFGCFSGVGQILATLPLIMLAAILVTLRIF